MPERRRILARRSARVAVATAFGLALLLVSFSTVRARMIERQQRSGSPGDARLVELTRSLRERERTPRGRIFIETPVNRARDAGLDSIGQRWVVLLERLINDGRIAYALHRDTVTAVERETSRSGYKAPQTNLKLADASINVMTVVAAQGDSVRLYVAVQRLRSGASPAAHEFLRERLKGKVSDEEIRKLVAPRKTRNVDPMASLESRPFAVVVMHHDDVQRTLSLMARALAGVIDEMRYCANDRHALPYSLPWCWMSENSVGMLKNYAHAPWTHWTP